MVHEVTGLQGYRVARLQGCKVTGLCLNSALLMKASIFCGVH